MNYYFCLGRENKISQKEVESVLANFGVYFSSSARTPRSSDILRSEGGVSQSDSSIFILSDEVLEIKSDFLDDKIAKKLITILGGTIKIFRQVGESVDEIAGILSKNQSPRKLILGISNYSNKSIDTFKLGLEVKKKLKGESSPRIIPPKDSDRLSSAQSFQYKLDKTGLEFGIFDTGIGQLVAVQNIDFWSKVDYGKPRADAKSGMLPPKLARIMINLAVGEIKITNSKLLISNKMTNDKMTNIRNSKLEIRNCDDFVADPFCGSGNILMQAVVLGFPVLGIDVSGKAIDDTKENLRWLFRSVIPDLVGDPLIVPAYRQGRDSRRSLPRATTRGGNDKRCVKIFQQDSTKFNFGEIDRDYIVVTEPDLGRPRREKFTENEAEIEAENIRKLYKKFFENLAKAKNQPLSICMVFPLLEMQNGKSLSIFDCLVDFLFDFGYTLSYLPLKYGRADQFVKREIVCLRQKDTRNKTPACRQARQ